MQNLNLDSVSVTRFSEVRAVGNLRQLLGSSQLPGNPNNEKEVVSLLHKGDESAIKANDIAKITGIKSRNVRDIISSLITIEHYPIGSTRALPNQGYYLITNEQEKNATVSVLESQIKNREKRVATLKAIKTR